MRILRNEKMVKCNKCGASIGIFEERESIDSGREIKEYHKSCYEDLQVEKKLDRQMSEYNRLKKEYFPKIINFINKIFSDEEENAFVKKLINDILKSKSFYVEISNPVGYKSKVLKLLREYDIIKKSGNCYTIYLSTKIYHPKSIIIECYNRFDLTQKKLLKNKKKNLEKNYICSNCEYKWTSKKTFGEPAFCPKCKSDKITSFEKLKQIIQ